MTRLPHDIPPQCQPSMADMWNEFPADPGQLRAAMAQQVAAHEPLAAMRAQYLPQEAPVAEADHSSLAAPVVQAHIEARSWILVKHLMQAAFVASVVLLVLSGGDSPMMALAYAATGLLLMAIMAVTDRQAFTEVGGGIELVEVVSAEAAATHQLDQHLAALEAAQRHALAGRPTYGAVHQGPLSPLAEHMQVVMSERVDVT